MADRPRRLTRQPQRTPVVHTANLITMPDTVAESPRGIKRKTADPQAQLLSILENPKSILTKIDISELLNANTWDMLSSQSQRALETLLPPTAFADYNSSDDSLNQPQPPDETAVCSAEKTLNPSVFNDPHFLDAAHTFQDHLFSGWLGASHAERLKRYLEGIQHGTLAVPWKDEVWENENASPSVPSITEKEGTGAAPVFGDNRKAGASADLKLSDLAKDGVLRVGDLVAYKRNFSMLGIGIEKDVIIQSIDPLTHTLTVLMPGGSIKSLPRSLTQRRPDAPGSEVLSVTISTPQMLENLILDTDGQVKKAQRPNGNAWKCFTVWRWRKGGSTNDITDDRGGRQVHGTLFYLRGCHCYEK